MITSDSERYQARRVVRLLYERDDETRDWPGPNAFKVSVIARDRTGTICPVPVALQSHH